MKQYVEIKNVYVYDALFIQVTVRINNEKIYSFEEIEEYPVRLFWVLYRVRYFLNHKVISK